MFTLIVILVLFWIVLVVLLPAWSIWFQGYLYTEPATGIFWRGPAAASAVMFVVLLWVVFAYHSPGRYRPLWDFSSSEDAKPFTELRVPGPRGEEVYKLRPGTVGDYRLNGLPGGKPLPARPPEIIVMEGGEKSVFKPERDAQGKFKQETTSTWLGTESKEPLRYIDEKGRVMEEGELGQLSRFRGGLFIGNVLLNLIFLATWFVVLWLLLLFQWPHALGQAIVCWLVILLFVLPPILIRAERIAQEGTAALPRTPIAQSLCRSARTAWILPS